MSILAIAAGVGYSTDLQNRVQRNTITVGDVRQKVNNTSDGFPLVIRHNGESAPVTGIKTLFPHSVILIAGEFSVYHAFSDRMRKNTVSAGDLRRAIKLLPEKCKISVKYQDSSAAPIYGLEKMDGP